MFDRLNVSVFQLSLFLANGCANGVAFHIAPFVLVAVSHVNAVLQWLCFFAGLVEVPVDKRQGLPAAAVDMIVFHDAVVNAKPNGLSTLQKVSAGFGKYFLVLVL